MMCTVTMILPNWLQLEYNEQPEGGEGREARIQHQLNRC